MTGGVREGRRPRRRRRGDARRRVFDTSVPSPCISVCQMDDDTGWCLGCSRAIDEIRDWPIMTAEEKVEVLARVAERKARRTGR
ncbi:MAG: DUF1289 domain-containing protein [Kiloniellaceae bacterium]